MSDGGGSWLSYERFTALSSVDQSLVNCSGVNQKLMGKSMCVSGAVKHTVVRGVMCESDSPRAVTPNSYSGQGGEHSFPKLN